MSSIVEEIKSLEIEPKYEISLDDYIAIAEMSRRDAVLLIHNGFKAGYIQGIKAEQNKSSQRKATGESKKRTRNIKSHCS